MKFKLHINGSESPKAAFIGWTPVKCTLTVEGYTGDVSMPVTISVGHKNQSGRIQLFEENSITSPSVTNLDHDFQEKRKYIFYVAGVFGNSSEGQKDTYINVKSESFDINELNRDIMVRVRKNANDLTPLEVEKFLTSFMLLSKFPAREFYKEDDSEVKPHKLLDELVLMHTLDASKEIHGRTSFHPWHRVFLLHLEREMQQIFPEVTIPYWKFDKKADKVFTPSFIGLTNEKTYQGDELGYTEESTPRFDHLNPLYTYVSHVFWGGPLRRAYRDKNPAEEASGYVSSEDEIIHGVDTSKSFWRWSRHEEMKSHNQAHYTFTGHVVDIGKDPVDPLFFMMHGNVDRLWARWQWEYNRFNGDEIKTYPFQGKYDSVRGEDWEETSEKNADGYYDVGDSDLGNFAEDTLWPWDLDQALSRPTRHWKSSREGYGEGKAPQINIEFPSSLTSNYPTDRLTVKSTIDYQDRVNNHVVQGFDYKYIPYLEKDKVIIPKVPLDYLEESRMTFFNANAKLSDRFDAANSLPLLNAEDDKKLDDIIKDKSENISLRLKSIGLTNEAKVTFLDSALKIIDDDKEDAEVRMGMIQKVFHSKRSNKQFASRKPEFFNALRGLLKNENNQLRLDAIEILAAHEDEVVQEFLVEEVQKEKSEFISKKDALFFLSQGVKNHHVKLFLEVFEKDTDEQVQKGVIEGLGNNLESYEFIKAVLLNKKQSYIVREAAALSLHNLNYKETNEIAIQILLDYEDNQGDIKLFENKNPKSAEVNFKAGLLNMLIYTASVSLLEGQDELKGILQELIKSDPEIKSEFLTSLERQGLTDRGDEVIIEILAENLVERMLKMLVND